MDKQYEQWLKQWKLLNPEPIKKDNKFFNISLWVMVISALLLSGTRTSTVIAETKMFTNLATLLNLPVFLFPIFTIVETLTGFLAFDLGLVVLGYVLGDKESAKNWVVIVALPLVLTILLANLTPAITLIGFKVIWLVLVNVSVAVSTIILSVFGSSMIASIQNNKKAEFEAKLSKWEQIKKDEWEKEQIKIKRRETRLANKKQKTIKAEPKKDKDNTNLEQRILDHIKQEGTTAIPLLVRELNADFEPVTTAIKKLMKDNKLKTHNGSSIKLQN